MNNTLKMIVGVALLSMLQTGLFAQQNEPAPARLDNLRILTIHPNPATERLLIEFTAGTMGDEIQLRLKNADGKVILRRNLIAFEGGNMVILPVAALPVGEYVVQLDAGRNARVARWQKM